MAWPVISRDPLVLSTSPSHEADLWATLIELTELRLGDWTLIGGQMVFLHGLEYGATPPRVTLDLDLLVNVRAGRTLQVPGGTQALQRTELVPVIAGTSVGLVLGPCLTRRTKT